MKWLACLMCIAAPFHTLCTFPKVNNPEIAADFFKLLEKRNLEEVRRVLGNSLLDVKTVRDNYGQSPLVALFLNALYRTVHERTAQNNITVADCFPYDILEELLRRKVSVHDFCSFMHNYKVKAGVLRLRDRALELMKQYGALPITYVPPTSPDRPYLTRAFSCTS